MENFKIFLLGCLMILLVIALMVFPFMWLWNWLMPVIFGLTKITFWQSFGLLVLGHMLFAAPNYSNKN